jgi:hypothetical protein
MDYKSVIHQIKEEESLDRIGGGQAFRFATIGIYRSIVFSLTNSLGRLSSL